MAQTQVTREINSVAARTTFGTTTISLMRSSACETHDRHRHQGAEHTREMAQTQVTRAMTLVAARTTSGTMTHSFGTTAIRHKCRTIPLGTRLAGSEGPTLNSTWALRRNRRRPWFEDRQIA